MLLYLGDSSFFLPLRLLKLDGSGWCNARKPVPILLLLWITHTKTIGFFQAVLWSRRLPLQRLPPDPGGTVALRDSLSVILQILLQQQVV